MYGSFTIIYLCKAGYAWGLVNFPDANTENCEVPKTFSDISAVYTDPKTNSNCTWKYAVVTI